MRECYEGVLGGGGDFEADAPNYTKRLQSLALSFCPSAEGYGRGMRPHMLRVETSNGNQQQKSVSHAWTTWQPTATLVY